MLPSGRTPLLADRAAFRDFQMILPHLIRVCVCLFTQNSLNLFITKLSAPIAILQRRPRQNAVYLAVYPTIHPAIYPAVYLAAYPVVCTAIDLLTTVAVSAVSEWLRFRCRNCRLKLLSDQRSPQIQRFLKT